MTTALGDLSRTDSQPYYFPYSSTSYLVIVDVLGRRFCLPVHFGHRHLHKVDKGDTRSRSERSRPIAVTPLRTECEDRWVFILTSINGLIISVPVDYISFT